MNGFVYFLVDDQVRVASPCTVAGACNGAPVLAPDVEPAKRALPWALEGCTPATATTADGPGSQPGLLLSRYDAPVYVPMEQVWRPVLSPTTLRRVPGAWVGCAKSPAGRPAASLLLRSEVAVGHTVRLRDGNRWTIPVIRRLPVGCGKPAVVIRRGLNGTIRKDTCGNLDELFSRAIAVTMDTAGGQRTERGVGREAQSAEEELLTLAELALGLNYRAGPAEVALLELLDSVNARAICEALVDLPNFEAFKGELQSGKRRIGAWSGLGAGASAYPAMCRRGVRFARTCCWARRRKRVRVRSQRRLPRCSAASRAQQ